MNINEPIVSVLMTVYNGEKFLEKSIESILNQNFDDYEFIIINDGSTDFSAKIISQYCYPHLIVIHNTINQGLISTLNYGFNIARGKYIARMDCDDLSLPQRLDRQVKYMEDHPEITVCGSWVKTIGQQVNRVWKYPTEPDEVNSQLLFESTLAHPTVIIRKNDIMSEPYLYDHRYEHAEDYELWVRLTQNNSLANLGEVLLLYRCHENQIGSQHGTTQRQVSDSLRLVQLRRLGVELSEEEKLLHQRLGTWEFNHNKEFICETKKWLHKLYQANTLTQVYPEAAFAKVLGRRWFAVCLTATCLGFWIWNEFWSSDLSRTANLSRKEKAAFGVKCGIQFKHKIR